MAFKAKVQLAESEYDALSCKYSFHRDKDVKGRPSSNVYGGAIRITVESHDDKNIVAQLMEQYKPVSGSVTFHKGEDAAPIKTLTWEKGYIMVYDETFDKRTGLPMQIYFEISAEKIIMNGETIDHKRPK